MEKKTKNAVAAWLRRAWGCGRAFAKKGLGVLEVYLDDLLLVGAGICFVRAAYEVQGRPLALAVSGACMLFYAILIARARRRGGN